MADLFALEELILPQLTDRLEAALELATGADAMARMAHIAELCREAQTLASAGALLARTDA